MVQRFSKNEKKKKINGHASANEIKAKNEKKNKRDYFSDILINGYKHMEK